MAAGPGAADQAAPRVRLSRLAVYGLLSGLISLSFIVDPLSPQRAQRWFWLFLAVLLAALWSSFPRWRSGWLHQATAVLTLLVVANLFLSPLVSLLAGPPALHGPIDTVLRVKPAEGVFPGISGIQTITTDGRGYRTNRPVDYAHKPPGTLRIVALGASTTEDGHLDDAATWTNLLAARLEQATGRPIEMINTGVSGVRLHHNYATFRDSRDYAPDVAIFMIGINDWNRQIRAAAQPGIVRAFDFLAPFAVSESLLFQAVRLLRNHLAMRHASDVLENDPTDYAARADSTRRRPLRAVRVEAVPADYARWLARISAECNARRIVCLYIDQPTAYRPEIEPRLLSLLWMTPPDESYTLSLDALRRVADLYNGWLKSSAQVDGIAFCGIADWLPPTTEVFYDDCHFNAAGARRVAALVADCLLPRLSP